MSFVVCCEFVFVVCGRCSFSVAPCVLFVDCCLLLACCALVICGICRLLLSPATCRRWIVGLCVASRFHSCVLFVVCSLTCVACCCSVFVVRWLLFVCWFVCGLSLFGVV